MSYEERVNENLATIYLYMIYEEELSTV